MSRLIFYWTFVLLPFTGLGQEDAIGPLVYELKGKLINEKPEVPYCGVMAFACVLEFEITEYSDANYSKNTIGGILTCPASYDDDFFTVGKEYKLVLSVRNESDFDWTIVGEKRLEKYELKNQLWISHITSVE